jgi:hypothetical protein
VRGHKVRADNFTNCTGIALCGLPLAVSLRSSLRQPLIAFRDAEHHRAHLRASGRIGLLGPIEASTSTTLGLFQHVLGQERVSYGDFPIDVGEIARLRMLGQLAVLVCLFPITLRPARRTFMHRPTPRLNKSPVRRWPLNSVIGCGIVVGERAAKRRRWDSERNVFRPQPLRRQGLGPPERGQSHSAGMGLAEELTSTMRATEGAGSAER